MKKLLNNLRKKDKKQLIFFSLLCLAVFLPIIVILYLLIRYSVNAPFWDQWSYVDLIDKLKSGNLSLYDLWFQHNEHRILVGKIITLSLATLTGWNLRFEVMANVAISAISLGLLFFLAKKTFTKNKIPYYLSIIVISWLLFSPLAYINWIWGFQIVWYLGVLFVIATTWCLIQYHSHNKNHWLILAIIMASLATYSLGNGILAWVLGLSLLLYQRKSIKVLLIWLASGGFIVATYLYKFQKPSSGSMNIVLHKPWDGINYVLAYLGRSLATGLDSSRATGLLLLIILIISVIYIYKNGHLDKIIGWLALAFYVLLTAILAVISRLSFGLIHSVNYSYTTVSSIFAISTLVILIFALTLYQENHQKNLNYKSIILFLSVGFISFPLMFSFIHNYSDGVRKIKEQNLHLQKIRACIYTITNPDDDCLLAAYPDKKTPWEKIQTLKKLKWSHFENNDW